MASTKNNACAIQNDKNIRTKRLFMLVRPIDGRKQQHREGHACSL
jgi:hypothetical protein